MKNIFAFLKGRPSGRGRTIGEFLARECGLEPSGRGRRAAQPSLTSIAPEAFAEALSSGSGTVISAWTEFDGPAFLFVSRAAGPEEEALAEKAAADLAALAAPRAALISKKLKAGSDAALAARLEAGSYFEALEGHLLVYARAELVNRADEALGEDERAREGGRAEPEAPTGLVIERSPELVLTRLFMPPRFPIGTGEAAVFWERLGERPDEGASPEATTPEGSLWFGAELEQGGRRHRLYFSSPAPAEASEEYRARVGAMVKAGWAAGAALLSRFGAKPGDAGKPALRFGPIAAPGGSALEGALFLEGELRFGSGGFGLTAVLPLPFQQFLAAALAQGSRPLGPESRLAAFMAANDELLAHWLSSYRAPYLALRKAPDASQAPRFMSLAAFLELLGDRDAAIVLQNFLAPRLGGQGLPYLFYRHVLVERNGKRAYRPFPLEPFHEARILRLLSPAVREDWEHEKLFDLPARTERADECLAANEATLRELAGAIGSGRLELSLDGQGLVEKEIKPKLEAEARAAMDALAEADIPFGFLEGLPRRETARVVDRLPNKELAIAALGEARHIDLIHRSMSGGRRRDFDEELSVAEKRLERGELTPERIAGVKRQLLGSMKERLESIRREDTASRTAPAERPRPQDSGAIVSGKDRRGASRGR
jgi:hypothetical protein